ncbi:hypothetical protein FACS189450_10280 [Spirochaetia bacterium]|nr:hypothetical protein FACS189450_10280 [Spirochaetia bacterium]
MHFLNKNLDDGFELNVVIDRLWGTRDEKQYVKDIVEGNREFTNKTLAERMNIIHAYYLIALNRLEKQHRYFRKKFGTSKEKKEYIYQKYINERIVCKKYFDDMSDILKLKQMGKAVDSTIQNYTDNYFMIKCKEEFPEPYAVAQKSEITKAPDTPEDETLKKVPIPAVMLELKNKHGKLKEGKNGKFDIIGNGKKGQTKDFLRFCANKEYFETKALDEKIIDTWINHGYTDGVLIKNITTAKKEVKEGKKERLNLALIERDAAMSDIKAVEKREQFVKKYGYNPIT